MKSGFHTTTKSVAEPRRSSKALPKAKLARKKGLCHSLVCCWSHPLQLSEADWNHYIWEVCSANQWGTLTTAKPAAGTNQQKGPNSSPWQLLMTHCTINTSKVEQIGLKSFASSTIFTWPFTKQLLLPQVSQHFSGKNTSTTSRTQKMLSKSLSNSKAQIFMLQE